MTTVSMPHRPTPRRHDARHRAPAVLSILVGAVLALAPLPAQAARGSSDLGAAVRSAIRGTGLRDAIFGVSIRDADTDSELVAVEGMRPLIPASNMKVLTSGAALHLLGPEFRFRTQLLLVDGGPGAAPTLVAQGDGDPGFADPLLLAQTSWVDAQGRQRTGMTGEELVDLWVAAVKAAGATRLARVVVDDRIFAREFFHPAWPAEQLNQRSFAEVAGFNFQLNLLHFLPRPGKGPRPEIGRTRPDAPWIAVENRATAQTGQKDKQTIWFSRAATENSFQARGNVKFAAAEPIEVPLHDPPRFVADLLAHRLRAAGVTVDRSGVAEPTDPAWTPGGAVRGIGPVIETPLRVALQRCNTNSQNLHAEAILKRIGRAVTGRPGSWDTGAEAVRRAMADRLGDASLMAGVEVSDGSGLSRRNRLTASFLTAWMNTFHRDSCLGPDFLDSLAVGGETGTLRTRFGRLAGSGVSVQCKTGFINGVSCLAGFVTMPDGRRASFAVLGNNLLEAGAVAKARTLQEQVVEAIVAHLRRTTPQLGGE